MMKIGILGGNNVVITMNLLYNLYIRSRFSVKQIDLVNNMEEIGGIYINSQDKYDILIFGIGEDNLPYDISLNILIILDSKVGINIKKISENMLKDGVILANSDDKQIFSLISRNKTRLITFGFSNKASVTPSSVMDNDFKTIQICIQRAFFTFAGNEILQQEFSVNLENESKNVYVVLAIVAATLISDISIGQINL